MGRTLGQGVQQAQNAVDDARRQRFQNLHARGTAYDIANKELAHNDAELYRQQQQEFAKRYGGGLLGGVSPESLPQLPQGQTTIVGAMAAHCLARYRFPGNRLALFVIFSTIVLPPQLTIISLFQILVEYGLINSLAGLMLVYVAIQLPLTVYILEGFFAQIPQDLFDAARVDGYSNVATFWRLTLPVGLPAIATTVILNFISLWNEFLYAVVLITDDEKRPLPLGIQKFMGDQGQDIGMISTGLMISMLPVIVIYVIFSEKMIQGMTAGAVK